MQMLQTIPSPTCYTFNHVALLSGGKVIPNLVVLLSGSEGEASVT